MVLTITTATTDIKPDYVDGKMVLGSQTVVVNFGSGGSDYFGGQVTLTREEDGISFLTTPEEIQYSAIKKAKELIANSELPTVS